MKSLMIAVLTLLLTTMLSPHACAGEELAYSIFYPGWGQIRSEQYGRGILFAGGELLSLVGLFISDIQYNRAVEDYESARAAYLGADYIGDAEYYYARMNEKWDDADRLHGYRNMFLGAAVGIWIVNIVDIAIGDGEDSPGLSMRVDRGTVIVTKGFAF